LIHFYKRSQNESFGFDKCSVCGGVERG